MKTSLVIAAIAVLVATTACSGDDDPSTEPTAAASTSATVDVDCPETEIDTQQYTPFRAVEAGSPKLAADLRIHDLDHRDFCVVPESFDTPDVAEKIVSYDVVLDDQDNYGEKYGTFARQPSDELLNFPFDFHVYGGCRTVTGTIVVRADGQEFSYVAEAHAGPECEGS